MVLPNGLKFLASGWWVVHAIMFLLVYQWGYVRGRGAEKRAKQAHELEQGRQK